MVQRILVGSIGEGGDVTPLGSVMHSMLTEAEFQNEFGNNWVAMIGQDIQGTDLAILKTGDAVTSYTLPDARGQFLRGLDESGTIDPDGAGRVLGDLQLDSMQGHRHDLYWGQTSGTPSPVGGTIIGSSVSTYSNVLIETDAIGDADLEDIAGNGVPRTSTETRPQNIAVNFFIKVNLEPVASVTPDFVDWADFDNTSEDKAITGITETINIQVSALYGTGTPVIEYRKNSGTYVAFTPGSPAVISIDNGDTLGFKVSGTGSDTATITVTNLSDSNTVLDTATGTVLDVGVVGAWSSTLKDSTITLSTGIVTNDTATSTDIDRRLVYGDLTTVGDGTYGTAKVYVEFILHQVGQGGAQDNQMVGFGVTAITPANFDPLNARGDCGFSLKFEGSQDLVFISPTDQFTTITSFSGIPQDGDVIGIALDTVNEEVRIWRNGIGGTAIDYTTGFDIGNDFTGQDIYVSAQLSSALGDVTQVEINSNATIPPEIAGQGFTLI